MDGTYSTRDLCQNALRIVLFTLIGFVVYSPFGSRWINNPLSTHSADGWDINRTAAAWDTAGWEWDFVDCLYFAMVTMTTVGYGDMPALRQEMRLLTIAFGFIGVTVIAGSITVRW